MLLQSVASTQRPEPTQFRVPQRFLSIMDFRLSLRHSIRATVSSEKDIWSEEAVMRSSPLHCMMAPGETAWPVLSCGIWAKTLRTLLFGALVSILSLAFAPGEAQAHGAHASNSLLEQSTSGDQKAESPAAVAKINASTLDCPTCCMSAGCLALAIVVTPTMPVFDVPGGAFAISASVIPYQAGRQGLRRPPRQNS